MGALAEDRRVQLEADEEHVEDHTDLGEDAEVRGDQRRQEERRDAGRDEAEERRAEQDPGHHLADHGRLPEVLEERAEDAGGDDDHCEGHQHVQQRVDLLAAGDGPERRRARRRRGLERSAQRSDEEEEHHGRDDHEAVGDADSQHRGPGVGERLGCHVLTLSELGGEMDSRVGDEHQDAVRHSPCRHRRDRSVECQFDPFAVRGLNPRHVAGDVRRRGIRTAVPVV